jgi:hypothetical protein
MMRKSGNRFSEKDGSGNSQNLLILRGSLRAVDRNGHYRFRTNQGVKGKPLCGAQSALDTLICSEKRGSVTVDGFSRTPLRVLTKIILPPWFLLPL